MNDLLSKYQQALMDMYVSAIYRFSRGQYRVLLWAIKG